MPASFPAPSLVARGGFAGLLLTLISPLPAPAEPAAGAGFGQAERAAFANPGPEYRPETWFHLIGGNVAKAGLTADLEAISQAGLGGIQLFHGQFGGPWPEVDPQIQCLSPEWDGMIHHAAVEARRLGLNFTMQNCPGWSMSGGPWITPENAMRQLVWSRTDLEVPVKIPAESVPQEFQLPQPQPSAEPWRDYRDVAVIAFPTPEGDTGEPLTPVSLASNRPELPWAACLSAAGTEGGPISLGLPGETWVEATFAKETTLRTLQLSPIQEFNHGWCYEPGASVKVEALLPGGPQTVAELEMPQSNWTDEQPMTIACAEVPATRYRVTLRNRHPLTLSYLRLFSGARQQNWEAEAGWTLRSLVPGPHARQAPAAWIDPTRIVDLSGQLDAAGRLRWQAPPGRWTLLRWGHVNTGKQNGPAPAEGTGWECNKLSPAGAEVQFRAYLGRIASPGGPGAGGLLNGMVLDSWECGSQTWTAELEQEFARLRGYGLRPLLPALAGYVIGSPERTTRFLRDWRATLNDLLVANFYGRMAALAKEQGLRVSYETAAGDVISGDILEYFKHADVPMCEFWQPHTEDFVGSFNFKPVKPTVSAARMYGKRRVAAEAFTNISLNWAEHPGMLKEVANLHFAEGVTHLVCHTYTHDPRTHGLPPGSSFGAGIGTPFLRGQTWWQHMPEFTRYLARCSELLERGQPVSDVLWYLGDEIDHKPSETAPFPAGYRHDYCNPDALLHRLTVREGCWATPEGIRYRLLWLPARGRMLPETLERLAVLVKEGGVLVGERPLGPATLSGGAEGEARFQQAVAALWDRPESWGTGRVIAGQSLTGALALLQIPPDVQGSGVRWQHRRQQGADWYFIAAPAAGGFRGDLRFRATGAVEIWDPATGDTRPAGLVQHEDATGTTRVALDLAPSEAVFVVFRQHDSDRAALPEIARVEHGGTSIARFQDPAALQVQSARYGHPTEDTQQLDVLERIRREVAAGASTLSADNAWAGSDPAPGVRKRLQITLTRTAGGPPEELSAWEGEPLRLAPETLQPEIAEVTDPATLLAWEPGDYRILRRDGSATTLTAAHPVPLNFDGAWTLTLPPGWGASAPVQLDQPASWTELTALPAEARAFSGTATYRNRFTLQALPPGGRLQLDLGQVEIIARVRLNGTLLRTRWAPPFQLDLTPAWQPGVNELTVEVTNPWRNRLAYDATLPEAERKTWTVAGPGPAPLIPAGLIGPVRLRLGQALTIPTP